MKSLLVLIGVSGSMPLQAGARVQGVDAGLSLQALFGFATITAVIMGG